MKYMTPDFPVDGDQAIRWQDDQLWLLDQRVLPGEVRYVVCETVEDTAQAITDMVVRGAPAIGITAAFGAVLAARAYSDESDLLQALTRLADARPTAINLLWAVERAREVIASVSAQARESSLLELAREIHAADIADNRHMGELGAALIDAGSSVQTHCNAGALATGGYGTALGVIRAAWEQDRLSEVFADETRPWLQGTRLTAWELARDGIPVKVLVEGAAASMMAAGKVQWVVVGADRVAANGDVANKIGTYGLAVLARHHGVRFMVVAPTSTLDMNCPSGADIPIEHRGSDELFGEPVEQGIQAWNPVFDVTPAEMVDVLVTERGVVHSPNTEKLAALMA